MNQTGKRPDHATPLTQEQADEVCEDMEDLPDTECRIDGRSYIIERLLVVPYSKDVVPGSVVDEVSRAAAMPMSPEGGGIYDVYLELTRLPEEQGPYYIDVRSFIEKMGMTYHFPA